MTQNNNILLEKYSNLLLEKKLEHNKRKDIIRAFIAFACKELGIVDPLPRVVINNSIDFGSKHKTFGYFNVEEDKIVVATSNRNLADMLRTLAHELVHYKQKQDGLINLNNAVENGKDGSDIEDEANAVAGVLLRVYGKKNPSIYE